MSPTPIRRTPPRHRHGGSTAVALAAAAVLAGTLACGALLAGTRPAAAHVTSGQTEAASGARTPVTFSFDHGCEGQPTTYLRIQIPDGVTDVTAEDPAGWTSSVTAQELRWDGGAVPDGETLPFVATMTIEAPEGTTIHFPTIQGCPDAEEAWIQIPDATNPEPDRPAPSIVVGGATAASLPSEPASDQAAATTAPPTTRPPLEDSPIASREVEQSTSGLVVFIVVMVVIIGGGLILYLVYRPKRSAPRS